MLRQSKFSLLFVVSTFISCSQFQSNRSYLSEMEHDDSTFFSPKEDFPVMAGDTGRDWATERERKERTPASEYDSAFDRSQNALRAELRGLEEKQSETSMAFYEKYKPKLATVSERIYFLKLSNGERRDYLETRGFMEVASASYTTREKMFAIHKSDILLGMSKNDVVVSWGKPLRVEVAGNPSYENERWVYNMNGATKYIYFESGEVQGWE